MVGNSHGKSKDKTKSSDTIDGTLSESQKDLKNKLIDFENIEESTANSLINSGFNTLKSIRDASISELMNTVSLDEQDAKKIKVEIRDFLKQEEKESSDDNELQQWLTGESEKELGGVLDEEIEPSKENDPLTSEGISDEEDVSALRNWLSGEEESFSEWLGEKSFEEEKEELKEELEDRKDEIEKKESELDEEKKEIENLKSTFKEKIQKIEEGEFDPEELVEE
ncbi:MAG: hypothetical protein ACOCSL_02750, partial [Thermoplasmatota archaeon]